MTAPTLNTRRPLAPQDTFRTIGPDEDAYIAGAMEPVVRTLAHVLVGNASVTGNIQLPDQVSWVGLANSGNVANLTVTMPNNPWDGQQVTIGEVGAGNLTATVVVQGGAPTGGTQATLLNTPTTMATLTSAEWGYDAATTTWYRLR